MVDQHYGSVARLLLGTFETCRRTLRMSADRGRPEVAGLRSERRDWVESRCGAVALGRTYLLPPLSSGGASMIPPWLRFHIPLIEPDRQISRIRLVWGFVCQGGVTPFWSSFVIPFFCSTRAASILPSRPHISIAVAAQRRSRTALLQRRRRLVLDGREHGGRLPAIGWLAAR